MQLYELLIPRVARAEQKKLLKGKASLKTRLGPVLSRLQGLLCGGYVGFDCLPAALQQHAVRPDLATWSVGEGAAAEEGVPF